MALCLLLTFALVTPVNAYDDEQSEKEEYKQIVLDYSFLTQDPASDAFANGFSKFFEGCNDLIAGVNSQDLDIALKYAADFKLSEINKVLQDANVVSFIESNPEAGDLAFSVTYFEKTYKGKFESSVVETLEQAINDTSNMPKAQIMSAINEYNKIIKKCDIPLTLFGKDYQPAADIKTKAEKALKKLTGSVDSKFYSSDVHKNNVGKILFSTNPIVGGKESSSQFTDKFTSDSNIYAVAYLPMPIQTLCPRSSKYNKANETTTFDVQISIDGSLGIPIEVIEMDIQDYQANKGYITFEILPNSKSTKGDCLDLWYRDLLSTLDKDQHKIELSVSVKGGPIANGSFDLDWSKADIAKIKKNIDQCSKVSADYKANLAKVPEVFKEKHKTYKDKALSDAKLKALLTKKFPDCAKILKFVNVGDNSSTWSIRKDEFNIPVLRRGTMKTWAIYKSKNGWCYIVEFSIASNYTGGGTWGETFIDGASTRKIAEKNVK